ncbi:MAG TPA: hypothetical protein VK530_15470, partial [Candidatus Acidoferrum sp.]|nr:hypothetical protein [Candidatus Acidoferrum sp.]
MNLKLRLSLFAFAILSALVSIQSHAADLVWTNAGSGNWSSAFNWSPNQAPGAGDNAFITNNGSYTVTVSADASVNTVTVGGSSGTQTIALSGAIFTIVGASTIGT